VTDREEITVSVNSHLTEHWSVGARTRRDIAEGAAIFHGMRAMYEDECFVFAVDVTRTFTTDRDVRPSDRLLFRFELKTIGAFETGT
jgi:LPS-assembly protein